MTFSGYTDPAGPVYRPPTDGFNSLRDGGYDLNIEAAKVHPVGAPGIDGAGNSTTVFHRLFGDSNGATSVGPIYSTVNTDDNLAFRSRFNNPSVNVPYFDFGGDGQINTTDNLQFRNRFNRPLSWSV